MFRGSLGQYTNPKTVQQLLAAGVLREFKKRKSKTQKIPHRLRGLNADLDKNLDLLKRGVPAETEFMRANESHREERTRLGARQQELSEWLELQTADSLSIQVRSFLDDFSTLDSRCAKALL